MKVAICTPVHGDPKIQYTRSLAALLIHTARQLPDLELRTVMAQGHLINARNAVANEALDWGADHLLWIDADTQFPAQGLVSLLSHGLSVVGCNYPTRTHPPGPTAFIQQPEGYAAIFTTPQIAEAHPLQEVSHMGLAFLLISAAALSKVGTPIFQPKPGHAMFLGEDEYLFERLRAAGETAFIDQILSLEIGHIGDYAYSNQIAARFANEQIRPR
jgi:hypothetical protein